MVIDWILLAIGFSALIIGTYTDIKTKEVPDWLNFSIIPAAIGVRLIYSLTYSDWMFFLQGLFGLIILMALAFLLYYTGQWGGGDSKLLMGMGVVFATYPSVLLEYFNPILNWHFLFIFLFNLVLVGSIYALIFSVYFAFRNWNSFSKKYLETLSQFRQPRRLVLVTTLILVAAGIFLKVPEIRILMLSLAILLFFIFHLFVFAKSVELSAMHKLIPVRKLTEGDWILKDVKIRGKYICGPKDLGISKEQIKLLKKNKVKEILIKDGIPFVPSFLIAMIVSLMWGNFIFALFMI